MTSRWSALLVTSSFLVVGALAMHSALARADDAKAEVREDVDSTKRALDKTGHRIKEAACTASKAECARRKTIDRIDEAKDHASDTVHETVDQVRGLDEMRELSGSSTLGAGALEPTSPERGAPPRTGRAFLATSLGPRRALRVLALAALLVLLYVALPLGVGLLLGALVAFVLQPFYDRLLRSRLRAAVAAAICAVGSVGLIGVAILCVGFLLVSRGLVLIAAFPDAVAPGGELHHLALRAVTLIGTFHVAPGDPLSRLKEGVGSLVYHTAGLASGVATAAAFTLLTLLFMGLATYSALLHWPRIVTRAERDLPFQPAHTRALFAEFRNVGRQILFGTVSAGLLQGILAGLGCWMTGVPEPLFLGALTAAVSLLPGLGVPLVWLGVGLLEIYTGHPSAGILEIAYGAVVVTLVVDYVVRPRLVGRGHLPAMFTLIGLLGGVAVFGLIGLILGPVVVSLCVAVLRIYDDEIVLESAPTEARA